VDRSGALIRVRVAGAAAAGVPAFEAEAVSAEDVRIVEPIGGAPVSTRSGDLLVRWEGGEGNEDGTNVDLTFSTNTTISCVAKAGSTFLVVPSALLREAISAEPAPGCCVTLGVSGRRSAHATAGDFEITLHHFTSESRELRLE